jgi:hypothetical protein
MKAYWDSSALVHAVAADKAKAAVLLTTDQFDFESLTDSRTPDIEVFPNVRFLPQDASRMA